MKRLTKEEVRNCATSVASANLGRACGKLLSRRIVKELLEYKEIEEKLGIDLAMLLHGLLDKEVVCVKLPYIPTEDGPLPEILAFNIAVETKWSFKKPCYFKLDIADVQCVFYLKDYGKTWAFDREELL